MRALAALVAADVAPLRGLAFDLDDTFLDRGRLGEAAYGALHRLHEAGFTLVACTGRPSSWAELAARQWPIDLAVAENGAVAWARRGERVVLVGDGAGRARRAELVALGERLILEAGGGPEAPAFADDNDGRRVDVTLDIGEHRRVPAEAVRRLRAAAAAAGARTFASSVHLHLTTSPHDKASGTLAALRAAAGWDATAARAAFAFVGDSGNDAAAFAAFRTTFGVANVVEHLAELTVPPRFVAPGPRGTGFVEIARALVALRPPPALRVC